MHAGREAVTERVVTLMTPTEKSNLEAKARGAGIAYRLLATAEPRTLTYSVGRFDDGRLYVRPGQGCWKLDRLEPAP